jgi:hypothetical protein
MISLWEMPRYDEPVVFYWTDIPVWYSYVVFPWGSKMRKRKEVTIELSKLPDEVYYEVVLLGFMRLKRRNKAIKKILDLKRRKKRK